MDLGGFPSAELGNKELFDSAIVGLAMARQDGAYLGVNAAYARLLGYDSPEHFLRNVRRGVELYADPAARERMVEAAEREGSVRDFETQLRRRDGSLMWASISCSAVRNAAGELVGYHSALFDISEARAARETLRESEDRFRSLTALSSDWYWQTDERHRFMYTPLRTTQITGLGAPSYVGKARWEVEGLCPVSGDWSEHRRTVDAREPFRDLELVQIRPDGSRCFLQINGEPVYDATGAFRGYRGTAKDITERRNAEEALRRNDAFFRSLVESASDAIAATDTQWRYLFISPSCITHTGHTPQELIGRRFAESSAVGDHAGMRERLAAELERTGKPQHMRFEVRRKDGEVRMHEAVVTRGSGPDGAPIYVIAGRDISDRIAAEQTIARRERELRTLLQSAPDVIARWSRELRCLFVNEAVRGPTGLPPSAFIGRRVDEMAAHAPLPEVVSRNCAEVFRTGTERSAELVYPTVTGRVYYEMRFVPELEADGTVGSVLTIGRDITDRKRAEQAVAESEARLRGIVYASAEPLLVVDAEGTTIFANPSACALFERPAGDLEGTRLGLPLVAGLPADLEIVLPNGGMRSVEIRFAPTQLDGREVMVVSLHDLSERKRFEARIEHLATHDGLTGLPNRALLGDRLEQAIAHARRTDGALALLFIDLDRFKLVNDSFGHAAGDALLMEVAARLRATVRAGDTVARLGGDEFVVLLTDLARPGDTSVVARKIAEALDRPVCLETGELRVTASIGIGLYPSDGDGLDALLRCADAAMYRAKDAGRNGFQYYSAEMGEQARARIETEAGLRRALEREEFRLHFQPQASLGSGEVLALEALLRWEHPQRGMVPPAAFIPVAEESGLIVPIGQWALHAACREAAGWAAAGLPDVKVAVNLSARQFWRGSVTEAVRSALGESGLPASQLEVEITESVVARDLQQVMFSLEQLRRMGVSVAIDDFGTGYSSLAYLRSLPISKLKIDKSFIQGIPADPEATALVGEIIRLAHVLSLEVVAEGVETAEQARFLREAGCEAMQGFLFARPLPPDRSAALLRSGRRFAIGN